MYVYKAFLKKVKRNSPLKFKKGTIYKKRRAGNIKMNNYTVRTPKTAICAVLLADAHGKRQESQTTCTNCAIDNLILIYFCKK